MITSTSLAHPMLKIRLNLAMRAATFESAKRNDIGISHVSGIDVVHYRNRAPAFEFYDTRDRNITPIVLAALRGSEAR